MFKKGIAAVLALVMVLAAFPLSAIADQVSGNLTSSASGVYKSDSDNENRVKNGYYVVCNDGENTNFTMAYYKYDISNIRSQGITVSSAPFTVQLSDTPSGDCQGLTFFYTNNDKADNVSNVTDGQTEFSNDINGSTGGHLERAKSFFALQEIKSYNYVSSWGAGSKFQIDIAAAINAAVAAGRNYCVIMVAQKQAGSTNSAGGWTDTHIKSGAVTVNYTGISTSEALKPADGTWTNSTPFELGDPSDNYRIPCIVTLDDGTLVAAADARWNAQMDGGGNDTIVGRSTDNGVNWNYTFANFLGDNGNTFNMESTGFCDSELATDGQTVYMLSLFFPSGVAINGSSATNQPEYASAFNSNGKLILRAKGSTANNYYLGDFGTDGFANIYTNAGAQVANYKVDKEYSLYNGNARVGSVFYKDSAYSTVKTSFLFFRSSKDKGATWSSPTLVPMQKASEKFLGVGPGRGLVIDNPSGSGKRIVFSTYTFDGQAAQRSSFIYSDDEGKTWTRSQDATDSSNFAAEAVWSSENQIVELNDGTLRMFFRNGNNRICYVDWVWNPSTKKYTRSDAVKTNLENCSDCMISAVKYPYLVEGENPNAPQQMILLSCPRTPGSRTQGCIYSILLNADNTIDYTAKYNSYDENSNPVGDPTYTTTEHWNYGATEAGNDFSYSCLTILKNGNVASLYEGVGTHIKFATFDAQKLIDNPNHQIRKKIVKPTTLNDPKYNITLKVGETHQYTTNSDYVLNTFDNVVGVKNDGTKITLVGKEEGTATVISGTQQFNVKVVGKYEKITMQNGTSLTREVSVNTASATAAGIVDTKFAALDTGGYKVTFRARAAGTTKITIGNNVYEIEVVSDLKYADIESLVHELQDKMAATDGIYTGFLDAYNAYLKAKETYGSWRYGENTAEMTDSTVTTNTTKKTEEDLDAAIANFRTKVNAIRKISPTTLTQSATYRAGTGVGWQGDYNDSGNLKYGDAGLTASTFNSNNYYKNVLYSTVGSNISFDHSSDSTAAKNEADTAVAAICDDNRNGYCYINALVYYQPTVFLYDGSDMCTTTIMKARSAQADNWGSDKYMKLYGVYPTSGTGAYLETYWAGYCVDTLAMTNSMWPRSVVTSDNNENGKRYTDTGYSASTAHEVPSVAPQPNYDRRATWSNQLFIDKNNLNFGSNYYQTIYPSWSFEYNRAGYTDYDTMKSRDDLYITTVRTDADDQGSGNKGGWSSFIRSKVTPLVVINYKQACADYKVTNFDITSHDYFYQDIRNLCAKMDSDAANVLNPSNGSKYNYASGMENVASTYSTNVTNAKTSITNQAANIMNQSNIEYGNLRNEILQSTIKKNEKCYNDTDWLNYINARKTAINAINTVTTADYQPTYADKAIGTLASELKNARNALAEGECHHHFTFSGKTANNAKAVYACQTVHTTGVETTGQADLSNGYNPLAYVYSTIDMNKYTEAGKTMLSDLKTDFDAATQEGATIENGGEGQHYTSDAAAQNFIDSKITALLTGINQANDKNSENRTKYTVKIQVNGVDQSTVTAYYNEPQSFTCNIPAGQKISKWTITNTDLNSTNTVRSSSTSIYYTVTGNTTINVETSENTTGTDVLITGKRNNEIFSAKYVPQGSVIKVTGNGNQLQVGDEVIMSAPVVPFWSTAFSWLVNGTTYKVGQQFTADADMVVVPQYYLQFSYDVALEDENAGEIITYNTGSGTTVEDERGTAVKPRYDQRMKLVASDAARGSFYAWALVKGGSYEIVSYKPEYEFFCEGNATYRMIKITDTNVPKYTPTIRVRNQSMACDEDGSVNGCFVRQPDTDGKNKITIQAQLVQNPDITKFQIQSCGIIATTDSTITDDKLVIGTPGVKVQSSKSQTIAGQFTVTCSSRNPFSYLKAKAYVTFTYTYSGEEITVTRYSDPVVVENIG